MKLSPTELRIYQLLADGEPHSQAELWAVSGRCKLDTLHRYLFDLRRKLQQCSNQVRLFMDHAQWKSRQLGKAAYQLCVVQRYDDSYCPEIITKQLSELAEITE